jgi:hypothetical protein
MMSLRPAIILRILGIELDMPNNSLVELFRAMIPDVDGFPKAGRSARMLGVRVPEDIVPDENGLVSPGSGGMSVAPGSEWNVPNHRRPRGMKNGSTGNAGDRMFAWLETLIPTDKLKVRADREYPDTHVYVEPAIMIKLTQYESDLADTRTDWRQVWP